MATCSNNRYENLDGLKVIAALGIVAVHVSSNMGHPLTLKLLGNSIAKTLSQVGVEVYLSHMMIFWFVEKMGITRRINNGNIAYIVVLLLTVGLTIIFALVAKKMIDTCFRKLKRAEKLRK